MFCWVVANKDTGDIEHCYYDTRPGADEIRARLAQGAADQPDRAGQSFTAEI